MRAKQENKIIERITPPLNTAYINQKTTTTMKTWIRIAVLALVAILGSLSLGGSIWGWLVAMFVGKSIVRLLLTITLAVVLYVLFYALIIGGMFWILIS